MFVMTRDRRHHQCRGPIACRPSMEEVVADRMCRMRRESACRTTERSDAAGFVVLRAGVDGWEIEREIGRLAIDRAGSGRSPD